MATIATLLERNKAAAAKHTPLPYLSEMSKVGAPPLRTLIVTCVDPRCIPENYFDIKAGEVLVHRNAGGNVRHAIRDILALDLLFSLDELAIVHHTDCGTLTFTNDKVREGLKARVTNKAHWPEIDSINWGANTDIAESVRGDIEWVRANPLIRDHLKNGCKGFVLDIKTGEAEPIKA